jgi:bifunctional DNA-binding transcriptional regulator/antitoxin component of YhaV-PrlF toxin-antitoxin module
MAVTYTTVVLGFGNHASIEIPDEVLTKLGANRRAALSVTINKHTYRSTATGMDGRCLVVFPQKDRAAAGVGAGDKVKVTLELEVGRREVEVPADLAKALTAAGAFKTFEALSYSKRREFVRQVEEAKAEATRLRRIEKVVAAVSASA